VCLFLFHLAIVCLVLFHQAIVCLVHFHLTIVCLVLFHLAIVCLVLFHLAIVCLVLFLYKLFMIYFYICSGGIQRDWVGVPRKYFRPGSPTPRCACVKNIGAPSHNPGVKNHKDNGDLDNPNG
jgi:hypothetical protein